MNNKENTFNKVVEESLSGKHGIMAETLARKVFVDIQASDEDRQALVEAFIRISEDIQTISRITRKYESMSTNEGVIK